MKYITKKYSTPLSGSKQGLREGDMRFTFIVKEELVMKVKEYAKLNDMSIRDAMEYLLTEGFRND